MRANFTNSLCYFRYHEAFDFVVSYSSIEHSGLGRFGDPLGESLR
uniref:Methyltransf_11 domain-containing protein n=1 Tax=Ascaris lumbricoides TaxID=6252 RepID=A0A0M3IPW5_ASCLU